uniref:ISXO2-like transposase domain-containing protein n=1 Tax=Amphimedon queenslandica TaxID=400682 RepID=A0A1X7TVC8_AMPQE
MATCSSTPSGSDNAKKDEEIRLMELYLIIRNGELVTWLRRRGLIGDFTDSDCGKCTGKMKLVKDSSYSKDGHCWRCSNRKCNSKVSIRRGSWFERSRLTISQIIKLTYFWVYKETETLAMRESNVSSWRSAQEWYSFCITVCTCTLEKESTPIGGPGETVELYESKRVSIGGRNANGPWVFSGIDRQSRDCFLVVVSDRSAETLVPIIKQFVKPGSKIVSHCWKSRCSLDKEGYIRVLATLDHSVEFFESSNHTLEIESTWREVMRSLFGGAAQSCYVEFLFRRKYLHDSHDQFLAFLEKVKSVYTPTLY